MNYYTVMTASARMPAPRWGGYRRVAVVEVDPSKLPAGRTEPAMISERVRGVVRIVRTWEKLYVGRTEACAYRRALKDAQELVWMLADPMRDPNIRGVDAMRLVEERNGRV